MRAFKRDASTTDIFRRLVEQTAGTVGREFFQALVHELAISLETDYAFVSEFDGSPPTTGHLLAVYGKGGFEEGYRFAVPESPSELVCLEHEVLLPKDVSKRFPKDTWLAEHGIESYAAAVMLGPDGVLLGHIGVLHTEPRNFTDDFLAVLKVMASRAAAEHQRLQVERAMTWSELKFSTAFRASPSIITIADRETGVLSDVSQAFGDLLGHQPDDVVGKTVEALGIWQDLDDRQRLLADLDERGKAAPREATMIDIDGRIHHMLVSAELIQLDRRSYVLSAMQDITDFRETQASLETTEQTYKALFNNSSDYLFLYEAPSRQGQGRFLEVNEAALRRLGFSLEEMREMAPADLLTRSALAETNDIAAELKAKGHMIFESELLARNGEVVPIEASAQLFRLDGKPVILSVSRDISERRAAEEARQLQIAAMEASVDGIALLDGSLRYVYSNEAHQRLNAYSSADEIIGKSWRELTVQEDIEKFERDVINRFHRDGYWRGEVMARRMDGSHYPQELSLTRIDEDNVICVIRDVSERHEQERALREAEAKYRQIFENAVEGIYRASQDGKLLDANPAFAELLGFKDNDELFESGRPSMANYFADPAMRPELMRKLEETGAYRDVEYELFRSDGARIWVSDNAQVVRDENGRILYHEGIVQDITARKSAEEALAQSEEKYRTLVDTSQDGVFIAQDGLLKYSNSSLNKILGAEDIDPRTTDLISLFHTEDQYIAREFLQIASASRRPVSFEARLMRHDDTDPRFVSVTATPVYYKGGDALTGTIRDVTEQKEAESQLLYNAFHDSLTGLPNRTRFLEKLESAMVECRNNSDARFAVLFLDLDRFKLINDSLGHHIGDKFLVEIAKRLRKCLDDRDILARHGGDEFTILAYSATDAELASALARRLHEALEQPFTIDGHEVFTNASFGIVMQAPHYRLAEEMLRDADTAMYRAKASGRSALAIFDDAMHQRARAHLQRESELRRAIEREEMVLHYQPIIDLNTRHTLGFEALLRWHHPVHGMLLPVDFLDIAEESTLILEIGWWAMRSACTRLAEWQRLDDQEELFVNVNIANRQFSSPLLTEMVKDTLQATKIQPDRLRLEITETVFMDNPDIAQQILLELREIGVRLQMDDFGTGYSSLSGLRNFPLHTLKIDKSFVQDIAEDESDLSIVRTIAQLARDLKMDIVAEGVETEDQFRLLREIGCELAQGFLFSPAMAARDVPAWLEKGPILDRSDEA
ncbi:MAG: PAS domain S-box protein [Gammaproteobacteria bacterium]|nr:PAS domain S-box protein [Gammaproteobacteria bacterium]